MTSSTGIASQGTKFEIATGSGAAKSITGGVAGVVTILTIPGHTFSKGDALDLAGITGTNLLTGRFPVLAKTTNTIAVNVDTTGLTLSFSGATATPVTYTEIANTKSFNGLDGTSSEIDRTHLRSEGKEVSLGLPDAGQFTIEVDVDTADPGQIAVHASKANQTLKPYRVTFSNGAVLSFNAYCKKFPFSGGVDAAVKTSIALRISGTYSLV